jgi:hypothetical protein
MAKKKQTKPKKSGRKDFAQIAFDVVKQATGARDKSTEKRRI